MWEAKMGESGWFTMFIYTLTHIGIIKNVINEVLDWSMQGWPWFSIWKTDVYNCIVPKIISLNYPPIYTENDYGQTVIGMSLSNHSQNGVACKCLPWKFSPSYLRCQPTLVDFLFFTRFDADYSLSLFLIYVLNVRQFLKQFSERLKLFHQMLGSHSLLCPGIPRRPRLSLTSDRFGLVRWLTDRCPCVPDFGEAG